MKKIQPTPRTQLKRLPKRGSYDGKTVESILDEGMVAHVGFLDHGQPFVLPMIYGRAKDELFLHGSAGGRALRALRSGAPLCVTVTLLDGLVMARSAFHHSMNYRCIVLLGSATEIKDRAQKISALRVISNHLFPGRWEDVRRPNDIELKQTTVISLPISECSAKVRTGPPLDKKEDYALPTWAGVVPTQTSFGQPLPDSKLPSNIPFPSYLSRLYQKRSP